MVAEAPPEPANEFTTEQLVQQINTFNPTAPHDFLASFTPTALRHYLMHLIACQEPRGRTARWRRTGETPAIMRWEPAV